MTGLPKYTPKSQRLSKKNQVKAPFGVVCKTVVAGLADLVLILRARCERVYCRIKPFSGQGGAPQRGAAGPALAPGSPGAGG